MNNRGKRKDNKVKEQIQKAIVMTIKTINLERDALVKAEVPQDQAQQISSKKVFVNDSIKIFLAYSKEDEALVLDLYKKLQEKGYKPWMYEQNLVGGQDYEKERRKAISESDLFIACLSSKNVQQSGQFQKDFKLGLVEHAEKPPGNIFFIPLKLDNCEIPDLQIEDFGLKLKALWPVDYWKPNGFKDLDKAIEHQFKTSKPEESEEKTLSSSLEPPDPIKKDPTYQRILRNIIAGKSIFILGPEINPQVHLKIEEFLIDLIGAQLTSKQKISELPKEERKKAIKNLLDQLKHPCPMCHFLTEYRPNPGNDPCPLIENSTAKCPQFSRLNLSVAKLNTRILSQNLPKDNDFYAQVQNAIVETIENYPIIYNLLTKLFVEARSKDRIYPLIINTNYDDGLEEAFICNNDISEFGTISYDVLTNKFLFQHFKIKDDPKDFKKKASQAQYKNPPSVDDQKIQKYLDGSEFPIILKFYGSWDNQFVIGENQYIKLSKKLKEIEEKGDIEGLNSIAQSYKGSIRIFLGFSPDSYDLEFILKNCPDPDYTDFRTLIFQVFLRKLEKTILEKYLNKPEDNLYSFNQEKTDEDISWETFITKFSKDLKELKK